MPVVKTSFLFGLSIAAVGCGGMGDGRFRLREALTADTDLQSVSIPCRREPTASHPREDIL